MSGFEEYAALARELSARQRGGEQAVAAEAERRRSLQAAVDQLGQRLAAQGRRLDQLGRAAGLSPAPATDAPDPAAAASSGAPVAAPIGPPGSGLPAPAPGPAGAPGTVPGTGTGAAPGSAPGANRAPANPPGTGAVATGGAAAAPGRAGVGAYPEGMVPGPREGDAAAELAAARQLVDEADRYGQQAEAIAHRPALLPTWSPPARAVAVYAACALAGSVLMLVALVGSPIPATGLSLVAAASCAGVPLLSFLAGHLVLGRWGRPPISTDLPSSRYVPLGFVICALFSPSLFCVYLLVFRLMR
ncbi:hypothetical protein ONA91_21255 [Micromonospora sp. DR5-3]|uniref:hypothetical protein n=1 Tax=unclassified Micromonospora TaxID=2617518 RepID=UPI0011D55F57|nr:MULTISPECIES: hypothetical protein [unclassified Micromonospora]MCW3816979.1 hypothetical protein [Micromonospora sp. DR5-3]TYC24084.1 hypothetical protein FXF52_12570 [Micromonospora sp. MP36]